MTEVLCEQIAEDAQIIFTLGRTDRLNVPLSEFGDVESNSLTQAPWR